MGNATALPRVLIRHNNYTTWMTPLTRIPVDGP